MTKLFPLVVIAWCLLSGFAAQAIPPLGRESDALILSADSQVTVKLKGESRLRRYQWNKRTEFFQHGKFAGTEGLRPGAAVRIRYRTPFF